MRKTIAIGIALLLLAGGVTRAGLMDRSNCLHGPTSYRTDVGGALDTLQERLVACFNYSNSIEVENHNEQGRAIQMLADKVNELETRVSVLEARAR